MVDFDRRLLRWAEYAFPDTSLNGPRERERVSGAPTGMEINAGSLYGHGAKRKFVVEEWKVYLGRKSQGLSHWLCGSA